MNGSGDYCECPQTRDIRCECFRWNVLVMLIGGDESGRLLEVAVAEGIEFIVHVMPAREKLLR